jgi:hypothetical protein
MCFVTSRPIMTYKREQTINLFEHIYLMDVYINKSVMTVRFVSFLSTQNKWESVNVSEEDDFVLESWNLPMTKTHEKEWKSKNCWPELFLLFSFSFLTVTLDRSPSDVFCFLLWVGSGDCRCFTGWNWLL